MTPDSSSGPWIATERSGRISIRSIAEIGMESRIGFPRVGRLPLIGSEARTGVNGRIETEAVAFPPACKQIPWVAQSVRADL